MIGSHPLKTIIKGLQMQTAVQDTCMWKWMLVKCNDFYY